METQTLKLPLTKPQLEILNLFTHEMEEIDLIELKRVLVNFFANKLTRIADKVWEQKKWSDDDMEQLIDSHIRTPYKTK